MRALPYFVAALLLGPAAVQGESPLDGSHAPSQPSDDDEVKERVRAALKRARSTRASFEEREAAFDDLHDLGAPGQRALASLLASELKRLHRANEKDLTEILERFPKRIEKLLKQRIGRAQDEEIESARADIRAGARDKGLTKERIQTVSDPAFARLTELLTVTVNQVWEFDEELFERFADLLEELDREEAWRARWVDARDALAAEEETAREAGRLREPDAIERDADALLDLLAGLAANGTRMPDRDREVLRDNAELARRLADELDPEEVRGVRALNLRRILIGLPAQRLDPLLCDACRTHSRDMVEHGFFAHDSPVEGRETPWKRAAQAGTSASAENIAAGAATGPAAIMQWWYSPGHHRNMLGGGSRAGLGRHERHWTQLFGG